MTLIDTLRWLVDIPSETGNEGRICTDIATRLLPSFGKAQVHRVANSLVVGERAGRPLVLLVGHLDTVPSQGQAPAHVDEGRMYGLGSCDMKGGLAVMLHLLEDTGVRTGPYDVVGVFYEGEEGPAAGNGLEPVLQRLPWLAEAVFAVVLEPCDGQIQIGCNGVVNAAVTFRGKSAHSARPWWGENAITKAATWLQQMHDRLPEPHVIDGLEYREVMSVTRASGGIANNIIPPEFTVNVNYRFNPRRTVEEAVHVLAAACDFADEIQVVDTAPAGPVRVDHPFVSALADASGAQLAPKQGWTDVARLGVYGIPAVNFGPGSAEQAHQAVEWVELGQLGAVFDALRSVLTVRG
jgi:succinyl-diaminopimelate desuccinylase